MTLDELRAAVKVQRDGSVVMRKDGRVIGRVRNMAGTTGWLGSPPGMVGGKWGHTRAAALDALLRAHLEHEHG